MLIRPLERPIVFATDINAGGEFGEEWLVVEDERVYVFSPNGGEKAHLIHEVPMRSIQRGDG